MRRREFISGLGGAVAWPFVARAQQGERTRRIVVLASGTVEGDREERNTAFVQGLQNLGWTVGRNVQIDSRWGAMDADRIGKYAAELVALAPDVILASGTSTMTPLLRLTRTVPIVFTNLGDPVGSGLIENLARPGGNATGFMLFEYGFAAKWLELLKQIAPGITRVTFIQDPINPVVPAYMRQLETAAASFAVTMSGATVRNSDEIERALNHVAQAPNSGLIVAPGPPIANHQTLLVALAARHRLPAVYPFHEVVKDGGLASYGVDGSDLFRRAASYVDRILKGEKPGDLPVQFATKFQLAINLKTAKALGLDPPIQLLARTDEVIE
jgi:putative tryptophan/tyrosine transport system substrate-binding protein